MIPMIEFIQLTDYSLLSAIGNTYGDIYEQQLELAMNSRLNKEQVPPYFEKYQKPIMKGGKLWYTQELSYA